MLDLHALPVPDLELRCRGCGYPLAHLPSHRCPECGLGFRLMDYVPEGYMPVLGVDGQEVSATPQVKELLSTHGIHSHDARDSAGELIPGLLGGGGSDVWRRVVRVDRGDYLAAQDLIRRLRRGLPLPAPPPHTDPVHVTDWACERCGEENPASFEVCWNCEGEGVGDEP